MVYYAFSRFAWTRPLRDKTGESVRKAFEDIFKEASCKKLFTDKGTEFHNRVLRDLLKSKGIELYSTHNEPKAMIAERFIRTLRRKIESNYVLTQSTVWIDILPQLTHEYNQTYHKSIKMTPEEARKPKNFFRVFNLEQWDNGPQTPRFAIGDRVRISIHKGLFTKEATASWSEEIFKITKVNLSDPVTYSLEDLSGEKIEGAFYTEQLQKTNQEIYRINKIIKRRQLADGNKECLVSWCGYPSKFNEWIPQSDINKSGVAVKLRE